jgi:hypothetical protein
MKTPIKEGLKYIFLGMALQRAIHQLTLHCRKGAVSGFHGLARHIPQSNIRAM